LDNFIADQKSILLLFLAYILRKSAFNSAILCEKENRCHSGLVKKSSTMDALVSFAPRAGYRVKALLMMTADDLTL